MAAPLGWMVLCLSVADVAKSAEFYAKLDFVVVGGDLADGWAIMQHPCGELHLYQGHINADMLNFRGGDVAQIVDELAGRKLKPAREMVEESDGSAGATYLDPDELPVYFNTFPEEAKRFAAGDEHTIDGAADRMKKESLLLGAFTYCLNCADLKGTFEFYLRLGLTRAGGSVEDGQIIMVNGEAPGSPAEMVGSMYLSLYGGSLSDNLLSFRGGDVFEIANVIEKRGIKLIQEPFTDDSGSDNMFAVDPDGHILYFNTYPQERLY